MTKPNKLEEWINIPLVMETKYGIVNGMIKYGIRLPIRSGTNPLKECESGSREIIDGEKAGYWFVNDEKVLKIEMITRRVSSDNIKGLAYDSGKLFRYNIRKN